MGRKNVVKTYKIMEEADLSGNIESSVTNVINLDSGSIHIIWTGSSPVGTITVEATNDDPESSSAQYRELGLGSAISISGNSGEHDIVFTYLPFRAIRLIYTRSSGTGSISATLSAKTLGA